MQNHHGGMVLVDGHVYFGNGHNQGLPMCVELLSGKAKWGPVRGPGSDSAAVLYADGHLYFRYQNAVMALIEATPEAYRLKASFKLPSHLADSWPHPVIANGHLYLRDQDVLMCYDLRDKPRGFFGACVNSRRQRQLPPPPAGSPRVSAIVSLQERQSPQL